MESMLTQLVNEHPWLKRIKKIKETGDDYTDEHNHRYFNLDYMKGKKGSQGNIHFRIGENRLFLCVNLKLFINNRFEVNIRGFPTDGLVGDDLYKTTSKLCGRNISNAFKRCENKCITVLYRFELRAHIFKNLSNKSRYIFEDYMKESLAKNNPFETLSIEDCERFYQESLKWQ